MLSFHKKYARDVYSQTGEDGVVEEILLRLHKHPSQGYQGTVCEFGAHDGIFCSNSRLLILNGFKGLLIEGSIDLYHKCVEAYLPSQALVLSGMVKPENVNYLLDDNYTVLSIDVDGIDYHIWKAYKGNADVVIIEINSSLDPLSVVQGDPLKGSSFGAMIKLGFEKGYFPVCHCGNIIFVKKEFHSLFPEIPYIVSVEQFFNTSWL